MKRLKYLIPAAVLLVLALLGGAYLWLNSQQQASVVIDEIRITSELPDYGISPQVDQTQLDGYLDQYGILETGIQVKGNTLTDATFAPVANVELVLTTTPESQYRPYQIRGIDLLATIGQRYDPSTKTLTIYVTPSEYSLETFSEEELESAISSWFLQGLYLSTQFPDFDVNPTTLNSDQEFQQFVNEYSQQQQSFIQLDKDVFKQFFYSVSSLAATKAFAIDCSGSTYQLGAAQTVYTCNGGTSHGASCNPNLPGQCFGGTCQGNTQCVATGGTGQCTDPGFGACVPGNLGNCDIGNCSQPPPPSVCPNGYINCPGCGGCMPNTQSCTSWSNNCCSSNGCGGGGGGGGGGGNSCTWCTSQSECNSVGGSWGGAGSSWCSAPLGGCCTPNNPPPTSPFCRITSVTGNGAFLEVGEVMNVTVNVDGTHWPPGEAWYGGLYFAPTSPGIIQMQGGVYGPYANPPGSFYTNSTTWPYMNHYLWNICCSAAWGPTSFIQPVRGNTPGTTAVTIHVSKGGPNSNFSYGTNMGSWNSCSQTITLNVLPACTPSCTPACGQSDGCGGTCGNTDSGIPTTPTNLNPANGTNTTDTNNNEAISWTNSSALTDNYRLEIYPVGTSCAHANAFCGNVTGTSYNYSLLNLPGTQFQWRVQANNYSCGLQSSPFTAWQTVGVLGTISGTLNADPSSSATFSGGNCSGGGGATSAGTGASITATGKLSQQFTGNITGSTFSVSPWYWNPSGNNVVTLNPGTAPNGEPYVCTCPTGCTFSGINSPSTGLRFYIQQNDLVNGGWWQVRGGSAYAAQTSGVAMRSYVPTFYCTLPTCIPYILGQDLTNSADSAGIAVTGGGAVDSTDDAGNSSANATQRATQTVATGTVNTRVKEGYDFFIRQFSLGLDPSDDFSGTAGDAQKPTNPPSSGKPAYYHNGDMTIQNPWTVTAGESITVFVTGNLTISDPSSAGQLITVEPGGFLAFIVQGNIIIDPSVGNSTLSSLNTNIEGIFIADGTISAPSAGTAAGGDKRLVAAGTYVGWTNVVIQRDFDDGGARKAQNNTIPASTFIFRPDFVLNVPEEMTRSSYIWQETN